MTPLFYGVSEGQILDTLEHPSFAEKTGYYSKMIYARLLIWKQKKKNKNA